MTYPDLDGLQYHSIITFWLLNIDWIFTTQDKVVLLRSTILVSIIPQLNHRDDQEIAFFARCHSHMLVHLDLTSLRNKPLTRYGCT